MTNTDKDRVIDLRSDTLTKPCPAMRRAIAEAEVGDDMYGEDPTVNLLQERAADLLGKEAALFVPSGAMANQIAIKAQTQPGDAMVVGHNAHNWMFEAGAAGFISSIQISVLGGDGRFDGQALRDVYRPDHSHFAPTRLVSVENTHNVGGGLVWEQAMVDDVLETARNLKLATHLDGARLWNATARTGRSEAELARGFDTVSVCLSKGLGAPVGSLLCGPRELIQRGRRLRRILGGAMRQAGIIAAAGLYAIDHNRDRLTEDHDNAEFLAVEFDRIPGFSVETEMVHTNIVMIDIDASLPDAHALEARAREHGLLFSCVSATRIRLVTHLDVNREDCNRAVTLMADLIR